MSFAKRAILIGVTILIVIGLSGCMKSKKMSYTPEGIKERMLAYLEEKYNEEFVPISLTMENWAYDYDSLRVYPKNGNSSYNREEDYRRVNDFLIETYHVMEV